METEILDKHRETIRQWIKDYALKHDLSPSEILCVISACTTDLCFAFNEAFEKAEVQHSWQQKQKSRDN